MSIAEDKTLTFSVRNGDASFVKNVVETITHKVRVLAINKINFLINTTHMCDEYILFRMGLLIIKSDAIVSDHPYIKDDEEETFIFDLDITGGENKTDIVAGMLQSRDKRVYPIDPHTIIGFLNEGERLKLIAYATPDSGSKHSKWCPVTKIFYEEDGDKYKVTFDSAGQLDPQTILAETMDILNS